jgi:hypothetical protein
MAKYAALTVDNWDRGLGASTEWPRAVVRPWRAVAATTTPTPAQEISIWITGAIFPRWLETARAALNALSALPANWNSYAARQIDVGAVTGAAELLLAVMEDDTPLPTFVPIANGGVLLEWHTAAADLEVAVLPTGRTHVVFEKGNTPVEVEGLSQEVTGSVKAFLQEI